MYLCVGKNNLKINHSNRCLEHKKKNAGNIKKKGNKLVEIKVKYKIPIVEYFMDCNCVMFVSEMSVKQ